MTEMIRVRAIGTGRVPHINAQNVLSKRRRWVGREDDGPKGELGKPLAEGELVPDTTFYHRRIAQGALELVDEPVAPTTDEPVAPAPSDGAPITPDTTKEGA